jgi:hypothetical protein
LPYRSAEGHELIGGDESAYQLTLEVCDQLAKVLDAEFGECDDSLAFLAGAIDDPESSVFGIHAQAEIVEPIFIDIKHLSDASDGEEVTEPGQDQAAI